MLSLMWRLKRDQHCFMVKTTWWFSYYKTQRLCLTCLFLTASLQQLLLLKLTLLGSSLGFWHTLLPGSPFVLFIVFLSTYFMCLSSFFLNGGSLMFCLWLSLPSSLRILPSLISLYFDGFDCHSVWTVTVKTVNYRVPPVRQPRLTYHLTDVTAIFSLLDETTELPCMVGSKIYLRYPRPHSK